MPRKRNIEVPGSPAALTSTEAGQAGADGAAGAPDPDTAAAGPNPDAFQAQATSLGGDESPNTAAPPSLAELTAMVQAQAKQNAELMATVKALQGQVAAGPRAAVHHAAEQKAPTLEQLGDLSKITTPTMTDKGLYVPPTFGANPNGHRI